MHSPLAYSAFEFRCSIERSLFELFILTQNRKAFQSQLKAVQRFRGLRDMILQTEGPKKVLYRKLLFNRLYAKGIGLPAKFWPSVPDIGVMERYWKQLSEYCHRQLQRETTWDALGDAWLNAGYDLLNEVEKYLWDITVTHQIGWFQINTLPSEMVKARKDFIEGVINENALAKRIEILKPTIQMRAKRKLQLP